MKTAIFLLWVTAVFAQNEITTTVAAITTVASPCNLFTGVCDVKDGYTIAVVKACKDLMYPQLPDNNDGLFVHSKTSDAMGNITYVVNNLQANCKFNANGVVNFGYNDCGTLASATTDADTTLTTFIHHQKTIDGTVISLMTEIEVNCVLNHANIVQGQTVAPQESSDFTVAVVAEKKDLKLTVGRMSVNGTFNTVTDGKLTIGEKVRISLETSNRDKGFIFSLLLSIA